MFVFKLHARVREKERVRPTDIFKGSYGHCLCTIILMCTEEILLIVHGVGLRVLLLI